MKQIRFENEKLKEMERKSNLNRNPHSLLVAVSSRRSYFINASLLLILTSVEHRVPCGVGRVSKNCCTVTY